MRNYTSLVNQNNFWEGLRAMQSVSPVFTDGEVQFEREIAKNQPEYTAVIGLPVTLEIIDPKSGESKRVPDWAISVRFRLSPEERAQVAAGLDLVVTQLTFGKPLAPMNFQFCPAKTKPVFQLAAEPPAPAVIEMPQAHGKTTYSVPDATGLADICPSCGETDKTVHAVCANPWHDVNLPVSEFLPNQSEQQEPAEDQPQSDE
jgi:hypothetical protein